MRIGISAYGINARDLAALATDAEAAGFSGVWVGEHVVTPRGYVSLHPRSGAPIQHFATPIVDQSIALTDPLIGLSAAAQTTSRIDLATGVYLAPLRHPLATARAACTMQELSGGRFVLGLGAGWLREEFAALDVPFESRYRRLEEGIDILREALAGHWIDRAQGEFKFESVRITSEPVPLRVVLGGNGEAALRRAARLADGWLSSGTPTLEEALRLRERLSLACDESGRSLQAWFRVPAVDPVDLERYRIEGFEDLVVWADQVWPVSDPAGRRGVLRAWGDALGLI